MVDKWERWQAKSIALHKGIRTHAYIPLSSPVDFSCCRCYFLMLIASSRPVAFSHVFVFVYHTPPIYLYL
jgi:hypothetical protein